MHTTLHRLAVLFFDCNAVLIDLSLVTDITSTRVLPCVQPVEPLCAASPHLPICHLSGGRSAGSKFSQTGVMLSP